MWSARLPRATSRNRLSLALERRRAAGLPVLDLTESNPTRTGIDYPANLGDIFRTRTPSQYAPSRWASRLGAARCRETTRGAGSTWRPSAWY